MIKYREKLKIILLNANLICLIHNPPLFYTFRNIFMSVPYSCQQWNILNNFNNLNVFSRMSLIFQFLFIYCLHLRKYQKDIQIEPQIVNRFDGFRFGTNLLLSINVSDIFIPPCYKENIKPLITRLTLRSLA